MSIRTTTPLPKLLLVEPDPLMRSTVAGVARDLGIAHVREASSHAAALEMLQHQKFEGLLIAVTDDGAGIELIQELRAGQLPTRAGVPVAVLATLCDGPRAHRLVALQVRRVVLKPFKVRTLLETVSKLLEDRSVVTAQATPVS